MSRERVGRGLLYALLLTAAWGLLVARRGLWHDDVQVLFRMLAAPGRGEWLPRFGSPTRWLVGAPSGLALWTGHPRFTLELLLGGTWLASALLAARVARRLWPGSRALGPLVCCLVLASTGDFFSGALVGLAYLLSGLLLLVALAAALEYLAGRGAVWLSLTVAAMTGSFGFSEAPTLVWLALPLGLPWSSAAWPRRRIAAAAWYAAGLPHLVLLTVALRDPSSYLRRALVTLGPRDWFEGLGGQLLWHFEPWRWGMARPLWQPREGAVLPDGVALGLALACGVAFFLLGPLRASAAPGAARLRWVLPGALALLAAQAPYVAVPMAEFHCRTHLVSRLFACLALGPALLALGARGPRSRMAALALATLYVALGARGGLERQDYLAGHWRRHRAELASLIDAAPRVGPEAHLLLRVRQDQGYPALAAGYLARAWLSLLHDDPSLECRVFLWSTPRGSSCRPETPGLVCRGERSPDCPGWEGRDAQLLPWGQLLYFDFDPASRRFRLLGELPLEDRLAVGPVPYAPARQLRPGPPAVLARRLLGAGP